jgi:hypothetical protein
MKTERRKLIIALILLAAACSQPPGREAAAPADIEQGQPSQAPATATSTQMATATTGVNSDSSDTPTELAAELEGLGFSLDGGEIGWVQPGAIELTNDGASNNWLADITAPDPVFQDYVLSVDIDWGEYSDENLGGCGVFVRISENGSDAIAFYTSLQFIANTWDLEQWNSDGFVGSLLKNQGSRVQPGIYADEIDAGTNHYDLIVTGNSVLVYVNGAPIKYVGGTQEVGAEYMPDQLTEGTLAFFARRDAGTFACTFSNGWVWRFN